MTPTDAQAQNIQGIGIPGFRKDQQQLIFVRIDDPKKALHLVDELSSRTANAWEVKRFNDQFSEMRQRSGSDPDELEATWVATLMSSNGYRKLGVNLDELPVGPGTDAFKAGMAARADAIGDTRAKDAPTQGLGQVRARAG